MDSAISRAYYKIQEACLRFKVPLNETWKVLDLGAAPGGWSQWLSQVAHIVVAVDPANMRIPTHKSAKFVPRTEPAKGICFLFLPFFALYVAIMMKQI